MSTSADTPSARTSGTRSRLGWTPAALPQTSPGVPPEPTITPSTESINSGSSATNLHETTEPLNQCPKDIQEILQLFSERAQSQQQQFDSQQQQLRGLMRFPALCSYLFLVMVWTGLLIAVFGWDSADCLPLPGTSGHIADKGTCSWWYIGRLVALAVLPSFFLQSYITCIASF